MLGRFNNQFLWLPAWGWLVVGIGLVGAHVLLIRSLGGALPALTPAMLGVVNLPVRAPLPATWMERHALRIEKDGSIRSDLLQYTGGPDGLGFWTLSVQGPVRPLASAPGPFDLLDMVSEWHCTLDATVWKSTGRSDDEATWIAARRAIDAALRENQLASAPLQTRALARTRSNAPPTVHDYPASVERVLWTIDRNEWIWPHICSNGAALLGPLMCIIGASLLAFRSKRERANLARLRGCCQWCGYDLTGGFDVVCPECGRAPKSE